MLKNILIIIALVIVSWIIKYFFEEWRSEARGYKKTHKKRIGKHGRAEREVYEVKGESYEKVLLV